jgi:tetratricopeptide (TPR) repeat protein
VAQNDTILAQRRPFSRVGWLYPAVAAAIVFAAWLLVRRSVPAWGLVFFAAGAMTGVLVGLLSRRHRQGATVSAPAVSATSLMSGAVTRQSPELQSEEGRGFLTPLELPPPPRQFVGREAEIAQIVGYLRESALPGPRTVVIFGPPGIGKSALAVRVAHQLIDDYVDGVLYAEFHGDLGDLANVAGDTVSALLGQGDPRPDTVPAQLELFRELTRDRRVLVVLDGVEELAEVRQLLPSGPRCAVVVTARDPLPDLQPGQLDVLLDQLPEADAVSLLGAIVGQDRVNRQETVAREIVRTLGRHPLAVQLAGTSLAGRPFWDLRLAVKRARAGFPPTLPPAFTGSLDIIYVLLTAEEQRAVRLLPLLRAQTFAPWMLAALLGMPHSTAWRIADRLVAAGLVERTRDDASGVPEFRVLDHVWEYAQALADAGPDTAAALRLRMEMERRAKLSPEQLLRSEAFVLAEHGTLSAALNKARDALTLAREHDPDSAGLALAALAELTAELGSLDEAEDLAWEASKSGDVASQVRALRCMGGVERRRRQLRAAAGHVDDGLESVPERDSGERIRLLCELAVIHALDRKYDEGRSAVAEAVRICQDRGDGGQRQMAGVLCARGIVEYHRRELTAARAHLEEAAELARQLGLQLSEGWIEHALGLVAVADGRSDEAVDITSRALDRFSGMRHRYGAAHCRVVLARAELARFMPESAVALLEDGLETFRNCGDRWIEADTSLLLAHVRHDLGHLDRATSAAEVSARLFEGLGDADRTADVVSLLDTLAADRSAAAPTGA